MPLPIFFWDATAQFSHWANNTKKGNSGLLADSIDSPKIKLIL